MCSKENPLWNKAGGRSKGKSAAAQAPRQENNVFAAPQPLQTENISEMEIAGAAGAATTAYQHDEENAALLVLPEVSGTGGKCV
eukprot:gene14052-biopygen8068